MPKVKVQFDKTKHLKGTEQKDFEFVQERIKELQASRKRVFGVDLESIWADADKDYIPHRLRTKGKKVIATDETKGWRGALVTLGRTDWQSDMSKPNPFVKIQTALSILIDRNPTGVFLPGASKYEAVNNLMSQLYQRSWEVIKSKQQLKLFVFNLAKYGWAVGRTYPLRLVKTVRNLVDYDEEQPEKSKWETKEVVEYNDVFRENLNPWQTWIDDMARPDNPFSLDDWTWEKDYSFSGAEKEFGNYSRFQFVKSKDIKESKGGAGPKKEYQRKEMVLAQFYESLSKDLFMVILNDVPVVIEPLPIADARGNKKLSCWQTYWNLRHAECPYGIGIYEAIRYDQALLDRIRNMTMDQLTLSIYKMFFYTGTERLTETGEIKITPGVGKQALDPKNINWMMVPPPGVEAWKGIEVLQSDVDEASGVTPPLMGEVTGKTAFEIAQAKEAALKRLKTPLDNVCDALEQEAYITISLIQLIYSIPEVIKIADPRLIADYLKEVGADKELWERDEETGEFAAKVYREVQLNLEEDEKGNLVETEETRFFRVKPRFLRWEGAIRVKPQSVLTPSKQLDKALDLEMINILIPLLASPPQAVGKIAKQLLKLYEKDPKDWLPDEWLTEGPAMAGGMARGAPPMFVSRGRPGMAEAERLVPRTEIPERPANLGQRLIGRLTAPFRKV